MNLTHDDVQNILKIIDDAEHLDEIELDIDGFRLHVRRNPSTGDASSPFVSVRERQANTPPPEPAAASAAAPSKVALAPGEIAIKAPMLGTFYRAASPDAKPFVEVGQRVRAEETVCLIEVMKLFNSVAAGVDGTIVRIPVENGSLVEFDQTLVVIAKAS